MTQEQIDWILLQDPQVLNRYRARFANNSGGAGHYMRTWSEEMGNDAWVTVLHGLNRKINECYSRAERHDFSFNLTLKDLADLWLAQQGRCSITGFIMNFDSGSIQVRNPYRCSVDRINSTRGYTSSNIRLLTHWANNAINTWDDGLFEQMILASAKRIKLQG